MILLSDSLEFAAKILELVKSELSKTTDVKKITLGIDVYVTNLRCIVLYILYELVNLSIRI